MGLLDEWAKVKRNESGPEAKKFALNNNTSRAKPIVRTGYNAANLNPANVSYDIGKGAGRKTSTPDSAPRYANKMQFDEDNYVPPQAPQMSLMDQLMAQLSQTYQPPSTAGGGMNADEAFKGYMASLDQALAAKLGAIGNVRDQAQQGYKTSDSNLAGMFGATANNIATQGSQRYNDIATQHKAGLTQTRDESLNRLSADRDKASATRAAMLKSLGIEEAGAAIDPGEETLNNAMTNITDRSNVALQGADQAQATNQSYNQSVVNSVNQQGAERRAALTQQLGAIQNQLGMAEAEARTSNETQKAQLQLQFQQAQAEAANATNPQDYQIWRDRQNLVYDIWNNLSQQEQEGMESEEALRVPGMGGLTQDLLNQGIPEDQAAQYMGILSNVLGSEYMKGVHPDEGYDRTSILIRRLQENQVPPAIAAHLATNYANLGNNAYYTAQ